MKTLTHNYNLMVMIKNSNLKTLIRYKNSDFATSSQLPEKFNNKSKS